jgi:hypothetical protein
MVRSIFIQTSTGNSEEGFADGFMTPFGDAFAIPDVTHDTVSDPGVRCLSQTPKRIVFGSPLGPRAIFHAACADWSPCTVYAIFRRVVI